jgi:hypothetical protein
MLEMTGGVLFEENVAMIVFVFIDKIKVLYIA